MLFSSITFVLYFLPAVLLLYYLCSFSRTVQNMILFMASIFFYAWGEVRFVFVMLLSIVVNTLMGYLIDRFRDRIRWCKSFVFLACSYNLGMLFVFKYLNFVIRNVNAITGGDIASVELALPLGISFYTFQAISYVVDVYRNQARMSKNPFYVGLYIAFFPQLIAGPIVKYNSIEEQIRLRKSSWDKFSLGCCRFLTGFGKKILLANNFAIIADHIFDISKGQTVAVSTAWLGAISYTLQIFFDFSAYSDMAIGLAGMFGFKLEENFNYPYISKSIGEFWRRWHISLSSFFREYVYFPLGGSKVDNDDKMVRNLFIVWLLTGIWHGAEWTFILWGLCNFAFILLERLFNFEKWNGPSWFKHVYALFLIVIGWTLFRANDLGCALQYLRNMFGIGGNPLWGDMTYMFIKEFGIFLLAGIILSTPIARRMNKLNADGKMGISGKVFDVLYPVGILAMFAICMSYLVIGSYNPFIYFNF